MGDSSSSSSSSSYPSFPTSSPSSFPSPSTVMDSSSSCPHDPISQASPSASVSSSGSTLASPSETSSPFSTMNNAIALPPDIQHDRSTQEPGPRKIRRIRLYSSSKMAAQSSSTSLATQDDTSLQGPSRRASKDPTLLLLSESFGSLKHVALEDSPSTILLPTSTVFSISLTSVTSSATVSADWTRNIYPLVWKVMGRRQWGHPMNPFVRNPRAEHEEAFSHLRTRVEVLEWRDSNNQAVEYQWMVSIAGPLSDLRRLSVTTTEHQQDLALVSLLQDETKLTKLKSLYLDLQQFEGQGQIPIRDLCSRMGHLHEPGIRGSCYAPATIEQTNGAQPWRLRSLQTSRTDLSLFPLCPKLCRLELKATPEQTVATPLQPILACSQLEELHFTGTMSFRVSGFIHIFPQLHSLEALTITLEEQDDFYHRLDPAAIMTTATGLEKLARYHKILFAILYRRPALKSFALRGVAIQPQLYFRDFNGSPTSPRIELELWLEIGISPALRNDLPGRQQMWKLVYSQLGRMSHLRDLTLKSSDLEKSKFTGFDLLGEATRLKNLSLIDPLDHLGLARRLIH
ncbi:hypothetical protein BGX23_007498 [Mortierella sp. AD031]|nr:hypothetical protein BGX23_007498 [Mortierella sp. AD031]